MSYTSSGYEINLSDGAVLNASADPSTSLILDFDGSDPTNLSDSSKTSLNLVRRGSRQYSDIVATDMVHLLENFSSSSQPNNPLNGQLWFDKSSNIIRVYDNSSAFNKITAGTAEQLLNAVSFSAAGADVSPALSSPTTLNGGATVNIPVNLSPTGVAPGTYPKVQVDSKGRVLNGMILNAQDIQTALGFLPTPSSGSVSSVGISTSTLRVSGSPITNNGTISVDLPSIVSSATYEKVFVDQYGRVTSGSNLSNGDIVGILGYQPVQSINSSTLSVTAGQNSSINLPVIGTGTGSGTVNKVSVDQYGRITGGSNLTQADLLAILGFTPSNSKFVYNQPLSGLSSGSGTYGYRWTNDGFLDFWGHITGVSLGQSTYNIPLPISFDTAPFGVTFQDIQPAGAGTSSNWINSYSLNTNSMQVWIQRGAGAGAGVAGLYFRVWGLKATQP